MDKAKKKKKGKDCECGGEKQLQKKNQESIMLVSMVRASI